MADDHIQRAYRASQPPVRSASGSAAGSAAGDPLAELARLIGQNDPFGEYGHGRGAAREAEPPGYAPQQMPAPEAYSDDRYAIPDARYAAPPVQAVPFAPPSAPPPSHYPQQGYGDAAYAQDSYAQDPYAQGIVPAQAGSNGYDQAPYFQNNPHSAAEDERYYDDVPPRRRVGVLAIAAVFALAVIGTAGAFGYRTLFGSSGTKTTPPPVIKADATPTKVVPAAQSKDPQTGKLIYDRVNNQNEKVVSREEQPLDIKDRPVGSVTPSGQAGPPSGTMQQASIGNGVIGGVEPKKIHTIAIHPTQPTGAAPESAAQPAPAPPPVQRAAAPSVAPRPVAETPPRQAAAPEARAAASNAPLSLNPNAAAAAPAPTPAAQQRPARTASAPTQIAPARTVAPPQAAPATGASGGFAVQIASRQNEADAQASFHSLQSKFPQQLSGRAPLIRRVDLGAKGIYYRAMVGPFGSAEEASQLCSNLKAAGGECLVQRI